MLALIPILPFLGFLVNASVGRRLSKTIAGGLASAVMVAAFAIAVTQVMALAGLPEGSREISQTVFTWIQSGDFSLDLTFRLDPLSALMILVITGIGSLIHIYSTAYMHDETDPDFARFFSYLNLFVFFMLLLVLGSNFLVMFVGWEGVGLCSYLLIGFYYVKKSAGDASKKAFIVNRVGDYAFVLGALLAFVTFGSLDFQIIAAKATPMAAETGAFGVLSLITLLMFVGATGKSAQIPLYTWLPDAMEGPTPVSALIHAATMVTAGVYMIGRNAVLFEHAPMTLQIVAVIGATTALFAGTIGLVQNDIKRVLAYSTVSQLGYMFLAMGVGAFGAGVFHLYTHAFFKACLFLGAGSVIHGMHEEQNIQKMGGLRKYMPVTFWTFLIASLANAGLIPFAGFWSKDEIIVGAWITNSIPISLGKILAVVALVTAFFSAFYMFRLVFLVFTGTPRFDEAHIHPHESPMSMSLPLVLLAIPSAVLGLWIGWPPEAGKIHSFLEPVFHAEEGDHAEGDEVASLYVVPRAEPALAQSEDEHATEEGAVAAEGEHAAEEGHHVSNETIIAFGVVSTLVALSGIWLAWLIYYAHRLPAPEERASALYRFLRDKWRFDELYNGLIVQPLRSLAYGLWEIVDTKIIDGAVNGVAYGIGAVSQRLRHVQTGLVTNYALSIALGMVVLLAVYLALTSSLFR